jgi:hypothetical protein
MYSIILPTPDMSTLKGCFHRRELPVLGGLGEGYVLLIASVLGVEHLGKDRR